MSRNVFKRILLTSSACFLVIASLAFTRSDHKAYKDASREDCQECHRSSDVPDNHGAFFLREHRSLAQKSSNNCNDCHQQSYCLDCHNGGKRRRHAEEPVAPRRVAACLAPDGLHLEPSHQGRRRSAELPSLPRAQ